MKLYNAAMISCIVLAAGESVRFGSPKLLAELLPGRPVIAVLIEQLIVSKISEIIIVLGAQRERIESAILKHKKVKVVYNKDYKLGQTTSFLAGLRQVDRKTQGIMLLPADTPAVRPSTVNQLITDFSDRRPLIQIPTYLGRKGHPPIFHSDLRKELLELDPQAGVNTIIRRYDTETVLVQVDDPGVTATFNTPQEFLAVKALLLAQVQNPAPEK